MKFDEGKRRPSLLDPESWGGEVARKGFRFQDEVALSYLPRWLSHEGFTEMASELMGDVEARFFVPGIGFVREFMETKDHLVAPSEFWKEVDRFRELHEGAPGTYRWYTLVSCGLSESLHPLRNSLRRVRGGYGFYDPGSAIQDQSYTDYEKQVLKHSGRTVADARFLFEMVLLESDFSSGSFGDGNFIGSVGTHLPQFCHVSASQLKGVATKARALLARGNNIPLTRIEIETCFAECGGVRELVDARPVFLEVSTQPRNHLSQKIEFDWVTFFGGEERVFPPPEDWNRIVEELEQTRDWIITGRRKRRIRLSGEQRLPVFMAIGAAFPATAGFVLEYENRDGIWKTNAYPDENTPPYDWVAEYVGSGGAKEIAVSVGVAKNIKSQVESDLEGRGLATLPKLHLFNEKPVLSDNHANLAVENAKRAIDKAVTAAKATKVHLYVGGPAQFALFLGHRLKAICELQLYVWSRQGAYSQACRLLP